MSQEVVKVLETQSSITEISLKASVVEENSSSLSVTLDPTLPKIQWLGQEFILFEATKQLVLELPKPMPIPIQPPYSSPESVERQRTLQKITQYQAYLSMEKSLLRTPLSELSSIELKAVEVLLEAAIGQANWNQIKEAIALVKPDRKDKVWFALSKEQRTKALLAFPPHYTLLKEAVKKNLIYDFQEDKSGKAIHLRIRNTVPGMFDELVSIENLESFFNTLSPRADFG
ncbi:hypothetical protein WA1_22060 [Scytonema hofmannii PCC 7110]|uniref:Uncharacterized protein n=1 Tax=Scytonema hofmannii PCC 7110 TaxID=128403 RepID=A0A139X9K9_9CYAN|nr:hypothetical protein [Scytonema hofmannii]KYC41388.1 hypothetical protein WA1_22060 [Scytonema hofmannii PCC 7110]